MQLLPKTHKVSQERAVFLSLPDDVVRKIIQALSFRDKCCFELVNKSSHALLSDPSPTEGLWGTCDLITDLRLNYRFDKREESMRWLSC